MKLVQEHRQRLPVHSVPGVAGTFSFGFGPCNRMGRKAMKSNHLKLVADNTVENFTEEQLLIENNEEATGVQQCENGVCMMSFDFAARLRAQRANKAA